MLKIRNLKRPLRFLMNTNKKMVFMLIGVVKAIGLLASLYFFICSLDIMSLSFRLVGGMIIYLINAKLNQVFFVIINLILLKAKR